MCPIIYYGNINKQGHHHSSLSYFLLYYYIVTHSYCVPTLYLLVPTLAMGAPHVASFVWPYSILTHLGSQILTHTYVHRRGSIVSKGEMKIGNMLRAGFKPTLVTIPD